MSPEDFMRRISAVLLVIVWTLLAGPAAQAPPPLRIALENQLNGPQPLAVSPDGSRIVYAANNRLYVQPMGNGPATAIAGTESTQAVTSPAFSPDGRSLVYWTAVDRMLKRVAVGGGTPVTIGLVDPPPFGISWGPNDQIAFAQPPKG